MNVLSVLNNLPILFSIGRRITEEKEKEEIAFLNEFYFLILTDTDRQKFGVHINFKLASGHIAIVQNCLLFYHWSTSCPNLVLYNL